MEQVQRIFWRRMLLCSIVVGLSGYTIVSFFDFLAVITHLEILSWLGMIAIPIILLPAMFFFAQITKKRKQAREAKQQGADNPMNNEQRWPWHKVRISIGIISILLVIGGGVFLNLGSILFFSLGMIAWCVAIVLLVTVMIVMIRTPEQAQIKRTKQSRRTIQ